MKKIKKFTGIANWFVGSEKESVQQKITDCIVAKNTNEDFERISFQVNPTKDCFEGYMQGFLKNGFFNGTLSLVVTKGDEKFYDIPGNECLNGTYEYLENAIILKGKGISKTENEYKFHITLNKLHIARKTRKSQAAS